MQGESAKFIQSDQIGLFDPESNGKPSLEVRGGEGRKREREGRKETCGEKERTAPHT